MKTIRWFLFASACASLLHADTLLVQDDFSGTAGSAPNPAEFQYAGPVDRNGSGVLNINTIGTGYGWLKSLDSATPGASETVILRFRGYAYAEGWYPGIDGNAQPRGLRIGADANNVIEFYSVARDRIGIRTRANGGETTATHAVASVYDWHDYEIIVTPASAVFKVDGTTAATLTTHLPSGPLNAYFTSTSGIGSNLPIALESLWFSIESPWPSIMSITPTSGPVGTTVTITGFDFTGTTAVRFGGVDATEFTVDSDTRITVTVPTGAVSGPVTVVTAMGTATSPESQHFTVGLTQTISFPHFPAKPLGSAPFVLDATASSGLPVTYQSSNPDVATIDGDTVTIHGIGSSILTARQPGDGTFLPAPTVGHLLKVRGAPARVAGWGYNGYRQCNPPEGLDGVVEVAAGSTHTLALKADGTVVAWGDNSYGQSSVPPGLDEVVDIAAGGTFSLALKSDGRVVAWGFHQDGQCDVPADLSGVVAITGGIYHGVALKDDGTVVVWGDARAGLREIPPGLKDVVAVAAGGVHTLALKQDGTVVAWAYNTSSQCNVPAGLSGVVAIDAGNEFSMALRSDGTVTVWGGSQSGWSGIIQPPAGLADVAAITAGCSSYFASALRRDGTVVSWGDRYSGQCDIPADLANVTAISGSGTHTVAITPDPPPPPEFTYSHDGSQITITGYLGFETDVVIPETIAGLPVVALADGAFRNRTGLASLSIPASVTMLGSPFEWPYTMPMTFKGCTNLTAFHVAGGNAAFRSIDGVLFSADGRTLLCYPPGRSGDYSVPAGTTDIGPGAFNYCSKVSSIRLPDGLIEIGLFAFYASNLSEIEMAASITRIGPMAFSSCPNLLAVRFIGNAPLLLDQWSPEMTFQGSPCTIHHLAGATGWPAVPDPWAGRPTALWTRLSIDGFSPTQGSAGTPVTLTGSDFTGATAVRFGGVDASGFAVDSDTRITATVPTGAASGPLTVVTPAGEATSIGSFHVIIDAAFSSTTTIPVTAESYNATGYSVNLSLGFAPPVGTSLMVVKNTGLAFISGQFSNLTHGQKVLLSYGGMNYPFVANYYGGTGNDLVLEWAYRKVSAWGRSNLGQLGDGMNSNSNVPVAVTQTGALAGKSVVAISAGGHHNLALCSDGMLTGWGSNDYGQLGIGTTVNSNTPVAVIQTGVLTGKMIVAISGGGWHSLALCSDGTLAAWGWNAYGQLGNGTTTNSNTPVAVNLTGMPAGKSIVAISADHSHSLALCSDGTVFAWGNNDFGQLGDGTLTSRNVPVEVDRSGILAGKKIIEVSCGSLHSLVLCSDGTLAAWGYNYYGQLGDGTTANSGVPVRINQTGVLGGKSVARISGGGISSFAICADGALASWGNNTYGQLGIGSFKNSNVPVNVNTSGVLAGKTVVAVSGGSDHSLALCSDGTLAAWGYNGYGQLGDGTNTHRNVPVAVNQSDVLAGKTIVAVSGGGAHSLALAAYAPSAALASLVPSNGELSPAFSPAVASYTLSVPHTTTSITFTPTAGESTDTIKVNGVTVASGTASPVIPLSPGENTITIDVSNYSTTTYTVVVTRIATLEASFSSADSIPLTADSYTASGSSVNLSLGFAPPVGTNLMIVKNTGLAFISGQFANLAHGQTVDLTYGGVTYRFVANYYGGSGNDLVLEWPYRQIVGWGDNGGGQLGDGTFSSSPLPVAVTQAGVLAGKTITAISCGVSHSLALCSDGTLVSWGSNNYGELGNGTTTASSTPVLVDRSGPLAGKTVVSVAAGGSCSLALCSDGSMASWGLGYFGQLGYGGTASSAVPVPVYQEGVLAGKAVVAVSCGSQHCLALCSDGTVAAWGSNGLGQLGGSGDGFNPTPVAVDQSGVLAGKLVVAISCGYDHSFALCSDGTIAAWGFNIYGALGDGTNASRQVPVLVDQGGVLSGKSVRSLAGGSFFSLALCSDGTLASWGDGTSGQLGDEAYPHVSPLPVLVDRSGVLQGKTVIAAACGNSHSLCLTSDGVLAAWGYNQQGQLGEGTANNNLLPVAVDQSGVLDGKPVLAIAAGNMHSLALAAYTPSSALASLTPSTGTLSPAFDPGITSYTLAVPPGTPSITLTPVAQTPDAIITVDGSPVVSGSPSAPISLGQSPTLVSITVTAADGATRSYGMEIVNGAVDLRPTAFGVEAGTPGPRAMVQLRYVITNEGNIGFTGGSSWWDAVYLSADKVLDPGDSWLAWGPEMNQPLAAGANYSHTLEVALPDLASGTWHLLIVADAWLNQLIEGSEDNNTRAIEFSVGGTFSTWASSHGLVGEDALPGATPANDGITNLMKYALAIEPFACGSDKMPFVGEEAGYLTLTFRQNKEAADIDFIVEAGDHLDSLIPGGVEISRVDGGDHWIVTVRDTVPVAGAARRFMRLKVELGS